MAATDDILNQMQVLQTMGAPNAGATGAPMTNPGYREQRVHQDTRAGQGRPDYTAQRDQWNGIQSAYRDQRGQPGGQHGFMQWLRQQLLARRNGQPSALPGQAAAPGNTGIVPPNLPATPPVDATLPTDAMPIDPTQAAAPIPIPQDPQAQQAVAQAAAQTPIPTFGSAFQQRAAQFQRQRAPRPYRGV